MAAVLDNTDEEQFHHCRVASQFLPSEGLMDVNKYIMSVLRGKVNVKQGKERISAGTE